MDGIDNKHKRILVLGVGNILQSDDGIGVHAIEQMRGELDDFDVELIDGGTAGLDLLNLIEDRDAILVVDAVDGGHPPGTIYRFTPDDIGGQSLRMESLHQLGLLETLRMARLMGREPRNTVIIGVQPENVGWGLTLTDTVARQLPMVIRQVKKEIEAARANGNRVNGKRN